ncbi:hypothetical protein TRVA0_009S02916 [Trichomonascus vanleenenianus]|uniref:uncharacterized protein n=1 Tax=Trichomonascus vanleenenianus TaxID=2268995 RepID=UPI003ECA72AE
MLTSIHFSNFAENDDVDRFISLVNQSEFFESMRLSSVSENMIHRLTKAFEKVHGELEMYSDSALNRANFFSELLKALLRRWSSRPLRFLWNKTKSSFMWNHL